MKTSPILDRLGLTTPAAPTLARLRAVHRAWRTRIPYENLDVQLGRPISLEPDALIDKFGRRRRGGFCFEMNGALALVLRDGGFAVTLIEGAVLRAVRGEQTWGNHVALLITIDGAVWLADCGIGDAFLEPLPLREGVHRQGRYHYRLERLDAETWRVHHDPTGTVASYDLRLGERRLDDFAASCHALSTTPDSGFVRVLVCQHHRDGVEHALRSREVSLTGPAGRSRRVLTGRAEFAEVLERQFSVPTADLGPDGLDRLWTRTASQHEAWLAIQERATAPGSAAP